MKYSSLLKGTWWVLKDCFYQLFFLTLYHSACWLRPLLTFSLFRYRVAIPLEQVLTWLGFQGSRSQEDWLSFSGHMGLSYTDSNKDKLDCKTSMAALPLQPKPAAWETFTRQDRENILIRNYFYRLKLETWTKFNSAWSTWKYVELWDGMWILFWREAMFLESINF